MSISSSIRALLNIKGLKQKDLLPAFGRTSIQGLSNKFREERWSAADLVTVADFTGCKLAFILPDGERVLISAGDPGTAGTAASPDLVQAAPAGDTAGAGQAGVTPANTDEK